MAGPSSGADAARARWELENNITAVSEVDGYFRYNQAEQQAIQAQKPWARDPHYFKQ
jgi:COP9 signalosome complex subunit 5